MTSKVKGYVILTREGYAHQDSDLLYNRPTFSPDICDATIWHSKDIADIRAGTIHDQYRWIGDIRVIPIVATYEY